MPYLTTMPAGGVLTCADLLRATGYDRVGDLRRSLDAQRVRYFLGKGGAVWTTIDLLNAAGGLLPSARASNEPLPAEDFQ